MDKHTVYNAVSGTIGIALAVLFFLILFGKIDVVGLVEEKGLGGATSIFEAHYLSAADAKAYVAKFLEGSPRALASKLGPAATNLGVTAVAPDNLYTHSTFRHNGGRCVRIGIIDDDTTEKVARIFLFVDRDGIVHVENDC